MDDATSFSRAPSDGVTHLSRRGLLRGGGAMIIGFSLSAPAQAQAARGAKAGPPDYQAVDTWIAIHADNTATIYTGKCELGQGNLSDCSAPRQTRGAEGHYWASIAAGQGRILARWGRTGCLASKHRGDLDRPRSIPPSKPPPTPAKRASSYMTSFFGCHW